MKDRPVANAVPSPATYNLTQNTQPSIHYVPAAPRRLLLHV